MILVVWLEITADFKSLYNKEGKAFTARVRAAYTERPVELEK